MCNFACGAVGRVCGPKSHRGGSCHRGNYKTFEAKRNLCDSYDLFMIDRRILPMTAKLLGNSFFRKKK